ncbi:MAG: cytochrome o ubiquinol oxidase subunit I [Candidatus Saccharimonadales bacterium]
MNDIVQFLFGKLTLDAIPHDIVTLGAGIGMTVGALSLVGLVTYLKRWKWLWKEWLTSLDPKKIGIMYLIVAAVMLLRGFADVIMLRIQQALANGNDGVFSADMFKQVFSAHGTIMIFFVAMGLLFGLVNLMVPLQIGARDVAFPFLNSVSFWLFVAGMIIINLPMVLGEFSAAGWLAYPPLSELQFSPGVGVDYWIWSLQIAGIGSLLSGVNFLVTILKMRTPGMKLMKMPIFSWSVLITMTMIIFAFPILTATITMLFLDRSMGMHFFTADAGGNMMMYINLIWAWGHPEVYILVLPAFGVFSEIVSTYSRKKLFGYTSMVWALSAIAFFSFIVWLHHFFTMGAGSHVNAFFGIMTMIIGIPTGVKIFNWLFTMFRGRIRFDSPMIWFMGFVFLFTIGGMTGIMLAVPAIDYQMHNSLFLVAHFHNMIIAGVVYGFFAGITYWWPKIFGFTLPETLGKAAAYCWIFGFVFAFFPLYILGGMGATRRLNTYDDGGWQVLFIIAGCGAALIGVGVLCQLLQVFFGIKNRAKNRDITGDPWNGRTLEWSTTSPAPHYNFAVLPHVTDRDQFWEDKRNGITTTRTDYADIHMPKNSPLGLYVAGFAFLVGFGAVWHIAWMAIVGVVGVIACLLYRLSDDNTEMTITADELRIHEQQHKEQAV